MKISYSDGNEIITTDADDPMSVAKSLKSEGDVVQPVRGWHTFSFSENGKSDIVTGPSARLIRADGRRVDVVSVRG